MLDSAAVIDAMGAADSAPQNDFDSSKIIQAMKNSASDNSAGKTAIGDPKRNPNLVPLMPGMDGYDQALEYDKSQDNKAASQNAEPSLYDKNMAVLKAGLVMGGNAIPATLGAIGGSAIGVARKIAGLPESGESMQKGAELLSPFSTKDPLANEYLNKAGEVLGALDPGYAAMGPQQAMTMRNPFANKTEKSIPKEYAIPEKTADKVIDVNYTGRQPTVTTAKVIEEPADTQKIEPQSLKENADLLRRIGLEKVRESALKGDKFGSSVDYQISKSPEAAGEAARTQLAAERTALENHAQSIVHDTGGSVGMDEYTVHNRGNVIAKPFDDYRAYFDKAEKNLYQQADEASQGAPIVKTATVEQLLNDRTFKNTLMAQKQDGLLNSMKDQLENFKENNPNGLTVKNAEQFRQWLNKNWNHENSAIIGEVKAALDNDTFSAAGSDIYNEARKLHQLKIQTLDAPNSMSKLFDASPNEPLNRRTPLKDIPDTILKLDPDNFKNVLNTLKNMPEELQPQAQQAIAEIKAHAANKLSEIGSQNQTQWNSRGVNQFIKNNGAKLDMLFDKPEEVQKIADLQSAGNLLRFESSYPGAAAQTQQFMKRGVGTSLITPAATVTGEALATLLGIPMGLGGAAGSVTGAKMAANTAEKAAAKKFEKSVTNLNDMTKVKK